MYGPRLTISWAEQSLNLLLQHLVGSPELKLGKINVKLFSKDETEPAVWFVVTLHPDGNEWTLQLARVLRLCVKIHRVHVSVRFHKSTAPDGDTLASPHPIGSWDSSCTAQ